MATRGQSLRWWPLPLLLLLSAGWPCSADFDLFVPGHSMRQLIKAFKDKQVYYVYNNTINVYALQFRILIPIGVNQLTFGWVSRSKKPLPYSIEFKNSNSMAMSKPKLNVSANGLLRPGERSGFTILLPCTGVVDAEIRVDINIRVTTSSPTVTSLSIPRTKLCAEGVTSVIRAPPTSSATSSSSSSSSSSSPHSNSFSSSSTLSARKLSIIIGASLISLLCLSLAGFVYFCRGVKRLSTGASTPLTVSAAVANFRKETSNATGAYQPVCHAYRIETCSQTSGYTSCSLHSHSRHSPCGDRLTPGDPAEIARQLAVDWTRVTLLCIVSEGKFGRIYKASLSGFGGIGETVTVKTVTDSCSSSHIANLLKRGTSLNGAQHPNVCSLLATASIPGRSSRPHLIYPYSDEGNLKKFLTRCRTAQATSEYSSLSTQQLSGLCLQLASALTHLHRRRIVHGDVAARNCVVSSDLSLQLCDSALSTDLFPCDYCPLATSHGHRLSPLRWLAPEFLPSAWRIDSNGFDDGEQVDGCVDDGGNYEDSAVDTNALTSYAGDVWALGVTLWELVTRCLTPYSDTSDSALPLAIKAGRRLGRPPNCPDQLFSVMRSCWQTQPEQRPKSVSVHACLVDFHGALGSYV